MRGTFWRGLIWGGIAAVLLGAVLPAMRRRPKPLVQRSVDSIRDSAHGLVKEAQHARKRLVKRLG